MAIPPFDQSPDKYFNEISNLNSKLGLQHLSLGMSMTTILLLNINPPS